MYAYRKFSNFFLVLALLAGLVGLALPVQAATPMMADLWVANGTVWTTLLSGNTLYIGGQFTYVGPPTGGFAALDAGGAPDKAFPPVNGTIFAIAADGAGGWYVGGSFDKVGGHPRNNLAHLKADKSLDFAWNPNANRKVYTLAAAGGTVYAGGEFTAIGGLSRSNIAALDASTGLATPWAPDANSIVWALAVAPDNTIYAGGQFTSIGGQSRNRIAALDASTGLPTTWEPNPNNSVVRSLAVAPPISEGSDSTIYAGGDFTNIGGQDRNRIAALHADTGLATDWDPNSDSIVYSLAVAPDNKIYAGGNFTHIGGQNRNRIAALHADSGLATDWDPNANDIVYSLAVAPGSTIYAAGGFTSIGGENRYYIAALDAETGSATTWNPIADSTVWSLGVNGSTISAGGAFVSIGGQLRNRIAALDVSTGSATAWNPNADNTVRSLALNGSTIYAGGLFTNIGGQDRNRIAALWVDTGLATDWNPDANDIVYSLAVASPISEGSDSTVYAGGDFTNIGGQDRNRIAALGAGTGLAADWNPDANGIVQSLALNGSTIYVGGDFTNIGGQDRNRIAALGVDTGRATDWNPDASNTVSALVVAPPVSGPGNSTIYAGGWFKSIGGQTRYYIAALDAGTGSATDWDPNSNHVVFTLALRNNTIYAGGWFSRIGGQLRDYIAALDVSTGNATAWSPNASNSVYTLAVGAGDSPIYAGGGFLTIGGQTHYAVAALRDGAAACQSAGSGGSWRASNWSNCGNAIPGDGDAAEVQAGHTITLYGNLAVNALTIQAGGEMELPRGSTLSVEDSLTNNGRLTQTLAVPTGATTIFLSIKNAADTTPKYLGVAITPSGNMGDTRVTVRGNQNCTIATNGVLVKRCFEIVPTTPRNATIRFYYNYAELNGQTYNLLKAWRQSFGWLQVGTPYSYSATCVAGQQNCCLEAQNVSVYSPFVLGSRVPIAFLPMMGR
jgi:hypothetical protein